MQKAQAQRDLLECAGGNLAHERGVRQPAIEPRDHDAPAVRLEIDATLRERCERHVNPEPLERSREPLAVPAGRVGEDCYCCRHFQASKPYTQHRGTENTEDTEKTKYDNVASAYPNRFASSVSRYLCNSLHHHTLTVHDAESIYRRGPIMNGHGPTLGGALNG